MPTGTIEITIRENAIGSVYEYGQIILSEEYMTIKVLSAQKEDFEQAMLYMNIVLGKEELIGSDENREFCTFNPKNLPELK